jgi:hypothetical protein
MDDGMTFIPNIWMARDTCLCDVWTNNVNDAIAHYKTDSLITFNEPEMDGVVGGSFLTVSEAVDRYRALMQLFAGRVSLGAPATTFTNPGSQGSWSCKYPLLSWDSIQVVNPSPPGLHDFLNSCKDCQVDSIPIHYFVSSSGNVGTFVEAFQTELRWLVETFKRPIWITEMHYDAPNQSDVIWFLRALIDFFEGQDWISRYSYRRARS